MLGGQLSRGGGAGIAPGCRTAIASSIDSAFTPDPYWWRWYDLEDGFSSSLNALWGYDVVSKTNDTVNFVFPRLWVNKDGTVAAFYTAGLPSKGVAPDVVWVLYVVDLYNPTNRAEIWGRHQQSTFSPSLAIDSTGCQVQISVTESDPQGGSTKHEKTLHLQSPPKH